MNKQFPTSSRTDDVNLESSKDFSFNFALDNAACSPEQQASTKKKKSKSKKKKPAHPETGDECNEIADATLSLCSASSFDGTDAKDDHLITELEDSTRDPEFNNPAVTDCTVAERPIIPIETKSKNKSRKNKKKEKYTFETDDEIDQLIRQITLTDTLQKTTTISSMQTSAVKQNVDSGSHENVGKASRKIDASTSSFSFKSHRDPELSEEQRSLFRFGNGKNLVAIGPPKHKGDPLWKLPTPPGLQISSDTGLGVHPGSTPQPLSHCSPFSFGFGL